MVTVVDGLLEYFRPPFVFTKCDSGIRSIGERDRPRHRAFVLGKHIECAALGVAPACQALGVSRATFYRRQRSTPGHQQPRPTPARALCEAEREQILDVLAGPRFVDRAPAEVVATLLDEGHYLCSERTMYRILAADQPVRERRNQREHPQYTKPELVATAPNQTWSWDITKLLGPTKWTYFYLYVVLDIFSRYAVGWMVADRENSALAGRLIEETCHKQGVQPQVLTLHSDRGAPMTSKCTAQLLADLGVTRSLSRPQVSDDNPFSEAQFKTLKYHPGFPGRFHDTTAAIAWTLLTKVETSCDRILIAGGANVEVEWEQGPAV